MRKVCVIGGSGFLGSHIADELAASGFETVIFDNKISPWLRDDQKMVEGNVLDQNAVEKAISGCDYVYNLAALADLNEALDRPLDTITTNILGNAHILEACRKQSVKRFIFASTVYVNGRHGSFYRCSKQAAEAYIEEYHRAFNLDYTILRYGSLYGPRSGDANGLYRIVREALLTGRLRYHGHASTMREYIHVQDAARASVAATGAEFCNKNFVLTGQEPMDVQGLLTMLREILDIKEEIEFIDKKYVGHYIQTPYSYQKKPGYKYVPPIHIDLGQGLLQLIEYVESHLGNSKATAKE